MNFNKVNTRQALLEWGEVIEQEVPGSKGSNRYNLLCEYAWSHNYYEKYDKIGGENIGSLNESFTPASMHMYSTINNVNGMGAVIPAGQPSTYASFFDPLSRGSGDKFPSMLPLSLQVVKKTIGFDLVDTIVMPGPSIQLAFLDTVYTGGKVAGCPERPLGIALRYRGGANITRDNLRNSINNITAPDNQLYWGVNGNYAVQMQFMGFSSITADSTWRIGQMFRLGGATPVIDNNITLAQIFDGSEDAYIVRNTTTNTPDDIANGDNVTFRAELVRAFEDHIIGYTGAGDFDEQPWTALPNHNILTSGMGREVGETTPYRTLGLKASNVYLAAKTRQAAMELTTEMIQDMDRQYGQQIVSMSETALINEISQGINRDILNLLFALGWTNHYNMFVAFQQTLNGSLDPNSTTDTTVTFVNRDGVPLTMPVPAYKEFGNMENLSTMQRRLYTKILAASNLIFQRGQRGPATFAVMNVLTASAFADGSQYIIAKADNDITQGKSLYPVGTLLGGISLYVDPYMQYNDNRILVGRKGGPEEPGVKLGLYIMAEIISTISEGTMSPKIACKSRYALVPAGFHPETQYFTFYVNNASQLGIG